MWEKEGKRLNLKFVGMEELKRSVFCKQEEILIPQLSEYLAWVRSDL